MQVQEILDSVKRQFGDESGVQVTDTDIIRWINQGMRQIVLQNENLLLVTGLASSVAGQQQYTMPTNMLTLKGVSYRSQDSTQYIRIHGYDLAKFNETVDGWDGSTEGPMDPVIYTMIGVSGPMAVFPVPYTSLTDAFKIYYNRAPVEIVNTTDTPELPLLYHEVLIKYCLTQAYELDEDWEAAGNKVADLDRDINFLRGRQDWAVQETYPVITVLQEDM